MDWSEAQTRDAREPVLREYEVHDKLGSNSRSVKGQDLGYKQASLLFIIILLRRVLEEARHSRIFFFFAFFCILFYQALYIGRMCSSQCQHGIAIPAEIILYLYLVKILSFIIH